MPISKFLPHTSLARSQRKNDLLDTLAPITTEIIGDGQRPPEVARWLMRPLAITAEPNRMKSPIALESGGHHITLFNPSDSLAKPVGDQSWQNFSGAQRSLAWMLAHRQWLDHWQHLTGIDWQTTNTAPNTPPVTSDDWILQWQVMGSGWSGRGLVLLSDATLAAIIVHQQTRGRTKKPLEPLWQARIPHHFNVWLPPLAVSQQTFAAFGTGDVIVLDHCAANPIPVRLTNSRQPYPQSQSPTPPTALAWQGLWQKQSLTLIHSFSLNSPAGSSSMTTPAHPGTAATTEPSNSSTPSLDTLPVTVEFCVGEHTVTLAELKHWKPGSEIPFNMEADHATLSIHANGQVIGHGQLIVIGTQLGIRIQQLNHAD